MRDEVDNNFLAMLLFPNVKPPLDPQTKIAVDHLPERMSAPLWALGIGVVTIHLRPFDWRAAIPLASMEIEASGTGSKRYPANSSAPWHKIKVDQQVVAIAKVSNADAMFTDDKDIAALARGAAMRVTSSWDLPVPATAQSLFDDVSDA